MGYHINNTYYGESVSSALTIFQKCSDNKIDLPCFCYHESLAIAGNCRMCLVETSNSVKLIVSCAMPMSDEIKIYTNNNRVKKAREGVLEFLLINHPLDCPICDQGGECDLQDITLVFGSDRSRFYEYTKRAVFDRDCGPLVKMLMTRCIHCTRCVRFLSEIAGSNDLGMLGRGDSSEIGTFIKYSLIDELSGNIIDLCPVGALTSKPYSFKARPWELSSIESVDILDTMASNIRVDFINNKVQRVLPIYDKNINEDWITNRARFVYDSNVYQRINYPMLKVNNVFVAITWRKAIHIFFFTLGKFLSKNVVPFFGSFNDVFLVSTMTEFFDFLGTEVYLVNHINIESDFRENYITDKIISIFENVNNLLFVNVNLRLDMPLLNAKLRKYYINYGMRIKLYAIGLSSSYYNLPIQNFGNYIVDFVDFIRGRSKLNLAIFNRSIYSSLFSFNVKNVFNLKIFCKDNVPLISNYTNVLNKYISVYLSLYVNYIIADISLISIFENNSYCRTYNKLQNSEKKRFIFLENTDDQYFLSSLNISNEDFVVYHGHFVGFGANLANLLIPSPSMYEYNGLFLNMEGRVRKLSKVISPINNLSSADFFVVLKLCYINYIKSNLSVIKNFKKIIGYFEFLLIDWNLDIQYYDTRILNYNILKIKSNIRNSFVYKDMILNSTILNFYKTDIYSLNSKNMHMASLEYLVRLKTFI